MASLFLLVSLGRVHPRCAASPLSWAAVWAAHGCFRPQMLAKVLPLGLIVPTRLRETLRGERERDLDRDLDLDLAGDLDLDPDLDLDLDLFGLARALA